MKCFLCFAALFILTGWLIGCGGDSVTTSQNQAPTVPTVPSDTPPAPPPDDTDVPVPSSGNPKDICHANNFEGEEFRVVGYANNIITANIQPVDCKSFNDLLKGEVRREGVRGLMEFVGDARRIHANEITIYTGRLPAMCLPKKGEKLKIIWKARRKRR